MSPAVFAARATADDARSLAALAAACFEDPWNEGQLREEIAWGPPGAILVLFRRSGRRAVPCALCAYRVLLDEVEVLDVGVAPELRRRGLGRFLVGLALRRAARAGARVALLEVRAANAGARALYQSLGFEPSGTRRGYYRNPVEDALLLRRDGLERLAGPSGFMAG